MLSNGDIVAFYVLGQNLNAASFNKETTLSGRTACAKVQSTPGGGSGVICNGKPVPGPLPILGAAAAFGYSRRLRSRVRAQGSDSSIL